MPARTFLAVIHTEHHLRRNPAQRVPGVVMRPLVIGRQRRKYLLPVVVLVRQQPRVTLLVDVKFGDALQQRAGADLADLAQLATAQAELLGQAKQRPGGQSARFRRVIALGLPAAQALRKIFPVVYFFTGRCRHARPDGVLQILRQLAFATGVAYPQLGRVAKKIVAEFREQQRQLPDTANQMLGIQTLKHQTHRQIIEHRHRRFTGLADAGLAGAQLALQEHSRPAGQLQRQALQIGAPVRLIGPEPAQLFDDHLQRIVRQPIDLAPRCRQVVQLPARILAGAQAPGGKKPLLARRVVPGRQPLIEMRRKVADQAGRSA